MLFIVLCTRMMLYKHACIYPYGIHTDQQVRIYVYAAQSAYSIFNIILQLVLVSGKQGTHQNVIWHCSVENVLPEMYCVRLVQTADEPIWMCIFSARGSVFDPSPVFIFETATHKMRNGNHLNWNNAQVVSCKDLFCALQKTVADKSTAMKNISSGR